MKKGSNTISSIFKYNTPIQAIKKGLITVYEAFIELLVSDIPPLTLLNSGGKKLVDYKIYGESIQSKLPEGYQQVDYIESTGEETLSTEYIDKPGTRIELDFIYTSIYIINTEMAYIGANAGNLLTISSDGYMSIAGNSSTDIVATPNTRYNVILERDTTGLRTGIINGVKKTGTKNTSAINKFFLVGLGGSTSSSKICGKIYSCKIWDNNTLVRDLIPCYRKSDSKVGMYDIVNNVFYTNTGEGELTKGMDVPNTEAPIEIESVGDKTNNLFDINGGFYDNPTNNKTEIDGENIIIPYSSGNSVSAEFLQFIPVTENKEYTCRFELIQGKSRILIRAYDIDKQIITEDLSITGFKYLSTYRGYWADLKQRTITFPSGIKYIRFCTVAMNNDDKVDNIYTNFQFVEGNTVPEYEPYGYKIPVEVSDETGKETITNIYLKEPLRKIGSDSDYIDFENSKVVRKIYGKALTSDLSWRDTWFPSLVVTLDPKEHALNNSVKVLSKYATNPNISISNVAGTGIGIYNTTTYWNCASMDEFKAWLDKHTDLIAYYALKTPIEEDIELPNIPTHKGTTIIEIDTSITPSNMEITYLGK